MARLIQFVFILAGSICFTKCQSFDEEDYSYEYSQESQEDLVPLQGRSDDLPRGFKEKYYDQCLDHFNSSDPSELCKNTWKQVTNNNNNNNNNNNCKLLFI